MLWWPEMQFKEGELYSPRCAYQPGICMQKYVLFEYRQDEPGDFNFLTRSDKFTQEWSSDNPVPNFLTLAFENLFSLRISM